MDLTVIIVNYNVKYFLEQCLHSVLRASRNIKVEIIVVDNNSVDGSCAMVTERFPGAGLIRNEENLGFSRANNQAIRKARGRYVLLLNPDTVIEEDTLVKCVAYMDAHPQAGALGVKMIDGKGKFLPESKRSLPTPSVAFYKIFGLSALFPGSRIFGKYHLGYLDRDQIHHVDVLTGAFMMIRRTALDEVGLLDEDFFMYGEDIDLSCRLTNAGYFNVYYPETTIIHYKGESTRKGSLNYVLTFYNAMLIFARKHYSRKIARSYSLVINLAIYFRAFLSILKRFVRNFSLPALQAILIFLGFLFITPAWEQVRFHGDLRYPAEYTAIVVPAYILIWLLSLFFSGAYDPVVRPGNIFRGIFAGTLVILVIYALLPESMRFSRALILMGAGLALISGYLVSFIFHMAGSAYFRFDIRKNKKIIIVGKEKEARRVESLLRKAEGSPDITGIVNPAPGDGKSYIGNISQLEEILKINKIDEIIFCARDISSRDIIQTMMRLPDGITEYKIAPPESLSIVGSNSINAPGDIYLIDFDSITNTPNKRNKRLLDICAAVLLLALFPVLLFLIKHPGRAFVNLLGVLAGRFSIVGFRYTGDRDVFNLLRPGILHPDDAFRDTEMTAETLENLNLAYARNYSILNDIRILFRGFNKLGQKSPKSELKD